MPNTRRSCGTVWRASAEICAKTSRTSRLCARTLRSGPKVSSVTPAGILTHNSTRLSAPTHFCSEFRTHDAGTAPAHVTLAPLNARRCSDLPCIAGVACRLARGLQKRCGGEGVRPGAALHADDEDTM